MEIKHISLALIIDIISFTVLNFIPLFLNEIVSISTKMV